MRRWLISWVALAGCWPAQADPKCARTTKVLLTAFEPYDGRPANGSQVMADLLVKKDPTRTCVQFQLCTLPVEYERGAKMAIDCLNAQNPKPDMVISMGESISCEINVDASAGPNTASEPDAIGHTRPGQIQKDQTWPELYTLPASSMACATQVRERKTAAQTRPTTGAYVCNYVAFQLAKHLKPRRIPFAFIHVPIPGMECIIDRPPGVIYDFKDGADQMVDMIHAATRALSISTSAFADKGFHSHFGRQVDHLAQLVTAACRHQQARTMAQIRESYRRLDEREKTAPTTPTNATDTPAGR